MFTPWVVSWSSYLETLKFKCIPENIHLALLVSTCKNMGSPYGVFGRTDTISAIGGKNPNSQLVGIK